MIVQYIKMAKLSGPRMKGGGYYSKGKRRKRPRIRSRSRDHLTLNEKKEVTVIAKKVVKESSESKYFNTTALNLLKRLTPIASRGGVVNNSCLAFSVGNPVVTGGYGSGSAPLVSLNMAKLFTVAATAPLNNNVLEGSKCMPSLMRTDWTINYPQLNTSANATGGSPIYVRFIRVKPKNLKYSNVTLEPRNDLFKDQYNVETGINRSTFNDMELQEYTLNRRKYQVLQDTSKVLFPTSTSADLQVTPGVTTSLVDNLGGNMSNWRFTINHKPNEKTYYYNNDPQAVGGDQNPQAGESSEMIFIHFTNLGLNGSALQKGDEVRVTCKPCATFKDI